MKDFFDRLRRDRVEQVFGIATVGGIIAFILLLFFAPDEILGMSKAFWIAIAIIWSVAVRVGLQVLRTIQHLDDLF